MSTRMIIAPFAAAKPFAAAYAAFSGLLVTAAITIPDPAHVATWLTVVLTAIGMGYGAIMVQLAKAAATARKVTSEAEATASEVKSRADAAALKVKADAEAVAIRVLATARAEATRIADEAARGSLSEQLDEARREIAENRESIEGLKAAAAATGVEHAATDAENRHLRDEIVALALRSLERQGETRPPPDGDHHAERR